jgi:hypothetical protein
MTHPTPDANTLVELASECERLAIEQAEFAVTDKMPHDAAQEYASLAANLFTCAAALRARAAAESAR